MVEEFEPQGKKYYSSHVVDIRLWNAILYLRLSRLTLVIKIAVFRLA
jgi:hypothetical protein